MGGNALKPLVTRRVDAREYYQLEAEISLILKQHDLVFFQTKNYGSKLSFGDIDIVVGESKEAVDVSQLFNPSVVKTNGNVISFDYKNVQVDLICIPDYDQAQFANHYFGYSDFGNLIGRVANRLGFKFSHTGLKYPLYAPNNPTFLIEELLVSDYFYQSLNLLDYDGDRYDLGFYCPEDVYEFVTTSKHFEPTAYLLGNRNHTARARDTKRPGYQAAVEFFKQKYNVSDADTYRAILDAEKFEFLSHVLSECPSFKNKYTRVLSEYHASTVSKQLITSDMYAQVFNIAGAALGEKIKQHKDWHKQNPSIIKQLDAVNRKTPLTNEQLLCFIKAIDLLVR